MRLLNDYQLGIIYKLHCEVKSITAFYAVNNIRRIPVELLDLCHFAFVLLSCLLRFLRAVEEIIPSPVANMVELALNPSNFDSSCGLTTKHYRTPNIVWSQRAHMVPSPYILALFKIDIVMGSALMLY
jgi:hypothetical protein